MNTLHHLSAPLSCTGKRSRSNSSSSSSSSSALSSTGASVFSQFTSADSLSSCSSPAVSSDASPYSSSGQEDEQRPCKTLRTERSTSTEAALDGLKKKCSLATEDIDSRQSSAEPEKQNSSSGKTVFVDCLVDAAVYVLDTIWEAPLDRSIAFVCDDDNMTYSASSAEDFMFATRSKACPVGRPVTSGIPLDLFIRETLRRSRTSCSTLQAALLFCKRVGGEVIRQRALKEGVTLAAHQLERLPGAKNVYASLQPSTLSNSESETPSPNDFILCNRRIFLASVMVSSKFLQDRTFSNRAWSKISGLNVRELCVVERRLLMALEFDLNIPEQRWSSWTDFLKKGGDGQFGWSRGQRVRCEVRSDSLPSSSSSSSSQAKARKSLERTNSLQVEEIFDTDLALPSGDEKAFLSSRERECGESPAVAVATTPTLTTLSSSLEVVNGTTGSTTPTLARQSSTGESTPTTAKASRSTLESRKGMAEASLLSTALHNQMLNMDGITHLSSELPLPFPLRKGLSTRSISSF